MKSCSAKTFAHKDQIRIGLSGSLILSPSVTIIKHHFSRFCITDKYCISEWMICAAIREPQPIQIRECSCSRVFVVTGNLRRLEEGFFNVLIPHTLPLRAYLV